METSKPAGVDWGSVELAYRAGRLSVREIATQHGVSHTAIAKRAAKSKWIREAQAVPKAKLAASSPATPKPAPSKPARLPVDFELVEKEYRLAKYSVRELAKRHGVGHQSILRRASKEGWTQDKAHEVNRRVAERLLLSAPHPVANPDRTGPDGHADHRNGGRENGPADASRKPRVDVTADDVEAAVEERVAVLVEHQRAGRDFRKIISSLGRELQETSEHITKSERRSTTKLMAQPLAEPACCAQSACRAARRAPPFSPGRLRTRPGSSAKLTTSTPSPKKMRVASRFKL